MHSPYRCRLLFEVVSCLHPHPNIYSVVGFFFFPLGPSPIEVNAKKSDWFEK